MPECPNRPTEDTWEEPPSSECSKHSRKNLKEQAQQTCLVCVQRRYKSHLVQHEIQRYYLPDILPQLFPDLNFH